jgi:hypothetical protein
MSARTATGICANSPGETSQTGSFRYWLRSFSGAANAVRREPPDRTEIASLIQIDISESHRPTF